MSRQVSLTIPWSHFAAVITSGAVNDVRTYLNGFAVVEDPVTHKLALCGTDGQRLTLARTEDAAVSPWPKNGLIFDYPEIRPKGKEARSDVTLTIDVDEPKASTIWWAGRSVPLSLVWVEGAYPDIWRVIPDSGRKCETTSEISFNPGLIAPIQKALKSDGCRFNMDGANRAILIDWMKCPEVKTVLMPTRW